ncbi:Retinaldehyde-binding protein 1 [Folsomia candida]|uniref:Retinaldehyde-binding protein 1 n=1 Tax=Folsomia candida TaxID=158441 RepID=A0A226DXB9_FOLCA|nr:Retinaldehyde-binding protein 1 [Folsomia candida]
MAGSCVSEFPPSKETKSGQESFCVAELRRLVLQDEELRPINFFLEDAFLLHFCTFKKYDVPETFKQQARSDVLSGLESFAVCTSFLTLICLVYYIVDPGGTAPRAVRPGECLSTSLHRRYGAAMQIQNYCAIHCFKYPARTERSIPSKCKLLGAGITNKLRNRDKNNRVVFLDSIGRWDYARGDFDDLLSLAFLQLEDAIRSVPSSADEGVVLLHDLGGVKISNLRIFTPARIRMIVDFYKVFVHSSYESLHAEVSKSILPTSLGGILEDNEAIDDTVEARIVAREEMYQGLTELSFSRAKV